MFLRAPYGISSITEHYDQGMDMAFDGLSGFRWIVDDVVVFDRDEANHIRHVKQFLQRCQERDISLNPDKFQFMTKEASFARFKLLSDGYSISPDITKAITDFPTTSSWTDLRSFFEQAKTLLTKAPTLAYFDINLQTRLITDASRLGLSFVLQQRHDNACKTVQSGSRFLTNTETRYAIIDLELLGVAWATNKCRMYLLGLDHFTVITYHNPLVPIFNTHRLDEILCLTTSRLLG